MFTLIVRGLRSQTFASLAHPWQQPIQAPKTAAKDATQHSTQRSNRITKQLWHQAPPLQQANVAPSTSLAASKDATVA